VLVITGLTQIITPSGLFPSFDTYPAFMCQREIRIYWLNISIRNTSHHEANLVLQFPRGTSRTYGQSRLCYCGSNSKRKSSGLQYTREELRELTCGVLLITLFFCTVGLSGNTKIEEEIFI